MPVHNQSFQITADSNPRKCNWERFICIRSHI